MFRPRRPRIFAVLVVYTVAEKSLCRLRISQRCGYVNKAAPISCLPCRASLIDDAHKLGRNERVFELGGRGQGRLRTRRAIAVLFGARIASTRSSVSTV